MTNQVHLGKSLAALETPCLLLDRQRMERNLERLRQRLAGLGVPLRPHLKTCKSVEIARRMMGSASGPATVSTLAEAEAFAAAGVRDLLYAVGIAPGKLEHVARLRRDGVDLTVILDSVEQAEAVAAASRTLKQVLPALIEIDADGHRAGVKPNNAELLLAIGRRLQAGGAEVRGVMTHAGASYGCRGVAAMERAAEQERAAVVTAAEILRAAALPCPVVSVGSTPTAHFARDLSGVTEVRAGVYVFFDLVMAGLGVCALEDIALSVLASVIGHQRDKGWTLVDAGWMAMSADRGTSAQPVDQGYGLVCDARGTIIPDLVMTGASQEHGILTRRPGSATSLPELPVGTQVRILPVHACATAAQFAAYHVLEDATDRVAALWPRI